MKSAFLTEMGFTGKIPRNHNNMRTEFAWMNTLDADHYNVHDYPHVKDYDAVFIIFPKENTKLNAIGVEMTSSHPDKDPGMYARPIVETLKANNKKVCNVQEGPAWFFNDYDIATQFNYYNQMAESDVIFAHNFHDTHFFRGLFPRTKIGTIPSLMLPNEHTCPFEWAPEDKAIIGGNFCRWYGGFQSYLVACDFNVPIYVPASHCKRPGEEQVPHLNHLSWVFWTKWMEQLSTFKYAVNLMPTEAAGTFSMNCGYYGIPCIGNEKVDTQACFFPELSVDVHDIHSARVLALQLRSDKGFYEQVSFHARKKFAMSVHGNTDLWLKHVKEVIYG